jgi:tRNA dimethylallyltransferase
MVVRANKPRVVVVVGATASGKTAIAERIASTFDGELIAADSRTVYRGMDVGTAKPSSPHYLIDIREPGHPYSAGEFQVDAERLIREIIARRKVPVVVGGTALYIRSLVDRWSLGAVAPNLRLRAELEQRTDLELREELARLDPSAEQHIDIANRRRLVRAIEIVRGAGTSLSEARTSGASPFVFLQIGALRTRQSLERRIRSRTRHMLAGGLISEVEHLVARFGEDCEALRGIVYRDVVSWLQGPKSNLETRRTLIRRLNTAQIRYAKTQMNWLRKDQRIVWVRSPQQAISQVRTFLAPHSSGFSGVA